MTFHSDRICEVTTCFGSARLVEILAKVYFDLVRE